MVHTMVFPCLTVPDRADGQKLLAFLSQRFINESKTSLRRLVGEGQILVNGQRVSTGTTVWRGNSITVPWELNFGPPPQGASKPEVLWEDDCHVVLNKPPGVTVLPARDGTQEFYDRIVSYMNRNSSRGGPYVRPHVVHRLDRGTSGVLIVAKTPSASKALSRQFQDRTIKKTYLAVVEGRFPVESAEVDLPLSRSDSSELAMVVDEQSGKPARTSIMRERVFRHFSLLRVKPHTGRQHQIRVHLRATGYPLVVDFLYGRRRILRGEEFHQMIGKKVVDPGDILLERFPLHAQSIRYRSPGETDAIREVEAAFPEDLHGFVSYLEKFDEC
ncbi:MAG: RluA family pseudouridine synthase [Candidatus Brocadiia bacterium]